MLTKSDRYVTRQVLSVAIFAVLILSVVLVLGNIFKEINDLLVQRKVEISFLGIFIAKLLPVSLVFTVPWGFLVAVLLVFGRLSSDQEINSLRSAGLSLYRIAAPVLILGFALSLFCFWINATVSPRSKNELKTLLYDSFKDDPWRLLDPGVVQSRLKGQQIYIQTKNDDKSLQGFHAYQVDTEDRNAPPLGYLYAKKVSPLRVDSSIDQIDLRLTGAYVEGNVKDLTKKTQLPQGFVGKIEPWILPLEASKKQKLRPSSLDNQEIRELLANPPPDLTQEKLNQFAFEGMRRYSFSMAPLAFAFIGIPLALSARRKKASSGAGLSLVVALGYFLFFTIADESQGDDLALSQILLWLPNILCVILGILLFRRATKRA